MKTKYVLGFLFSYNRDRVLLIQKNRPEWQRGKLNGVGGHIEIGETPIQAMNRECKEESGLEVDPWRQFLIIESTDNIVYCFRAFTKEMPLALSLPQLTDEYVDVYKIAQLNRGGLVTVNHLRWLIPLGLDNDVYSAQIVYL